MMDVDMESSGGDEIMGPSDDDAPTPFEVLQKFQRGWLNEKLAPELLIPLTDEVEIMMDQLKELGRKLSLCGPRDETVKHYQLEGERIRYLVASYLRTRLSKIQQYAWYIREQEIARPPNSEIPSRLMAEEQKFLKEYLQVVEGHLTSAGTANMPRNFQTLHPKRIMIAPNNNSFVFVRPYKDLNVMVEDTEGNVDDVHLQPDTQWIIKYNPISALVNNLEVQLV